MDPKNQPQFNPKIPVSEVLKKEQTGFVPSAPVIPKPNLTSENKIIKTYKSDAAEVVKKQQASMAKIALEQEAARRERGEEIGASSKKNIGLSILVVILLLIGAAAIPTVKYFLNRKNVAVPLIMEITIIPFDQEEDAVLNFATRTELLSALDKVKAKSLPASKIEYIKIMNKVLDAEQKQVLQRVPAETFAGLIGTNIPSALARSFDSDYMFGRASGGKDSYFALFKTSSYEQTFANMLKWEQKMASDLAPIFDLDQGLSASKFSDQVIANKDVRAITGPEGDIMFFYGFLDNKTLIITTDPVVFQVINNKYIATRFVQ